MKKSKFIFLALFTSLALSACTTLPTTSTTSSPQFTLNYAPEYSVVVQTESGVSIKQAQIDQEDQYLTVSGRVRRMYDLQLPGHIDLTICNTDGATIAQEKTKIPGLSSNRKGVLELPFRFQLAMVLPEGAQVHLRYHAPSPDSTELICDQL